jgi:hypothetical protein
VHAHGPLPCMAHVDLQPVVRVVKISVHGRNRGDVVAEAEAMAASVEAGLFVIVSTTITPVELAPGFLVASEPVAISAHVSKSGCALGPSRCR